MKAITIKQPWASLIIDGPKRIENRTRRTHVRGWVLVHAGKSCKLEDWLDWCDFAESHNLLQISDHPKDLPRGGIIGAMHIVDCKSDADQLGGYPINSPWFVGPFGYVIDRVVKLPFFPCQGKQGWFNVELPPEMEALIPKA